MEPCQQLLDTRVLIVEDEYLIMDEAKRAIEDAGGIVVGAHGHLDHELFSESAMNSDVAILDINIRGQMVFPLAGALLGRGVPFVFATGYDLGMIPDEFIGAPRLQKPFGAREIVRAVANACRRPPAAG